MAKKYTDKNRPSGFYEVAGKGKRYWNSYTKKWTKSPLGSTDAMLSKASGRDVTATTQKIKDGLKLVARTYRDAVGKQGKPQNTVQKNAARKEGTRATLNGKPVVWKNGKWVSASKTWSKAHGAKSDKPSSGDPSTWKKKEKPATPSGDKDTNATPARLKHGMNTARISELMTKWKAAKGADKDRLGRQIHRLKYEKTAKGLKIRKKPLSKAGELGWQGRTEA